MYSGSGSSMYVSYYMMIAVPGVRRAGCVFTLLYSFGDDPEHPEIWTMFTLKTYWELK